MTPTHATKGAVRYRYYTSSVLVQGQADQAGSVSRVSGPEIENIVVGAVLKHFSLSPDIDAAAVIQNHVLRIEVHVSKLIVQLTGPPASAAIAKRKPTQIEVPWQKPRRPDVAKSSYHNRRRHIGNLPYPLGESRSPRRIHRPRTPLAQRTHD